MKEKRVISSFTVIVTFICVALIGLALVPLLPVKLSPSRELPGLTVSFSMPGNSARVIESTVTSRLESMLARIQGVRSVTSTSSNGYGRISLSLDKHADIANTRFETSTIIRQAWSQLPEGVGYPQISTRMADNNASRPFMTYTLNAPSNPIEIQQYAEENVKPVIARLRGIYKVELSGATPMEWQLEYDNSRLDPLGITADKIRQAIMRHYDNEFLGIAGYDGENGREWIRVVRQSGEVSDGFNPADISIATASGEVVSLDKIVTVKHVEAAPQSYFRINGLNSIYVSITAEESANQLKLSTEVKNLMSELSRKMPPGYMVELNYDATDTINSELDKIYFRTGLTVLILLLFVGLITLNMRYLLLITIGLSINVAIAVILYYVLDIEIQLYSLAGITISLNLIIDNLIVMTDHITHRHNLKAFAAVLAATLTTIGALVVVFFMDDKIRLSLQDFVAVVMINLAISLMVALFLVPALIDKLGIKQRTSSRRFGCKRKRFAVHVTRIYRHVINFSCRHRVLLCVLLVLAFGLPVFMLPEKLEGDGRWAEYYNKVFDNDTYREKVKPVVDAAFGGTLRLFVDKVYGGGYFDRGEGELELQIYATLPNGSTLDQMNELIKNMESYLTEFAGIRQFQTSVYSARRAGISVYFTKEHQHSGFPYALKSKVISRALTLGGGSWSVHGLPDQGFNNDVRESAGSFRVKLYGYNYDELEKWAEYLKNRLLQRKRIKEVTVNSEFSWWKDDYSEFYLDIDKEKLAKENMSVSQLFSVIQPVFGREINCGSVPVDRHSEQVKLSSLQGRQYDVWALMNMPFAIGNKSFKLTDFATLERRQTPQSVAKENQQYRLCLQYEYIGSSTQGNKFLDADLKELNDMMPMGYTAEKDDRYYYFGSGDTTPYWLLLLVITIIFFTSGILFNSLRQPLAIIFIIPASFIGVFLTFYMFGISFDQGGFASFILLCGITVNAAIYILNEYNAIRRRHRGMSKLTAYTKAWNAKITPIFLTVVSTILGFIPFLIGEGREAFWFPLAVGTIGGLAMSLIAIFIFLPVFTLPRPPRKPRKSRRRRKIRKAPAVSVKGLDDSPVGLADSRGVD